MGAEPERRDPWLKFFHTDWQADEALQLCSLAARGLWFEMILYMHKADPYGYLLINGKAPTHEELIRRLRPKSKREFTDALEELRTNGVYSATDDGVIYCRRMLRRSGRVQASRENGLSGGRPKKPSENLSGNLDPNLDRNLKDPPRGQKLEARNQRQSPRPPTNGSKRPIFKGQRFTVFEWFLDRAGQILGNHFNSFGIDEWFYELDARTAKADEVVPDRDGGTWLANELLAEAKRRGLPIASASSKTSADDEFHARLPRAWTCETCGQVHEGTAEQKRRGECLKQTS